MLKCINFFLLSFFKKWTTIALLVLFLIVVFVMIGVMSGTGNDTQASIAHVKWYDVISPYLFGCLFVLFLVLHIFRSTGIGLLINVKPMTRWEVFAAKLLALIIAIVFFVLFVFVVFAIAGNIEHHAKATYVLKHAATLMIGSLLVTFAFGSFAVLLVQFASTIAYGVLMAFSIVATFTFSMALSVLNTNQFINTNPVEVSVLKQDLSSDKKGVYTIAWDQEKRPLEYADGLKSTYKTLAPIDVFYQWNTLFTLVQPSDYKSDSVAMLSYAQAVQAPRVIDNLQDAMLITDSNSASYALMASGQGLGRPINPELMKIFTNKSQQDARYQKLIRALFESSQLSIFDKLVLILYFNDSGNFGSISYINGVPTSPFYDFDHAKENLANRFNINYDEIQNQISYLGNGQAIENKLNINADLQMSFITLHDMIESDQLVANATPENDEVNNFHGIFNTSLPVQNIYDFKPWIATKNIILFWTLMPLATLTVAGVLYLRKDFRE